MVVVVAVAAIVLLSGGGSGGGGPAGQGGGQATGEITACPPAGQPAVCITAVERSGNALQVGVHDPRRHIGQRRDASRSADGHVLPGVEHPDADSSTGVALRQWGNASPFEEQYSDEELNGASAVCVLVGNGVGQIAPGTGNCAELPSS